MVCPKCSKEYDETKGSCPFCNEEAGSQEATAEASAPIEAASSVAASSALTEQEKENSKNKKGESSLGFLGNKKIFFGIMFAIIGMSMISTSFIFAYMVKNNILNLTGTTNTTTPLTYAEGEAAPTIPVTETNVVIVMPSDLSSVPDSSEFITEVLPSVPAISSPTPSVPDVTDTNLAQKYEELEKNGDNKLSDDPENEFIKLVSEQYKIDPSRLVAIYSEPDTGTNFVLEFRKDLTGKIVKSPNTLIAVYHIDINKNITKSSSFSTDPEQVITFQLVKKLVIKQYPDYFTGV